MNLATRELISSGLVAFAVAISVARAEPVKVVAAENVYGDIARQIGGANVIVTSILTNPNQDPHEFEASVATARAIAEAKLVICNGADYDPWAVKLLSASQNASREVIEVASLIHGKPGDNPHFWYEPGAVSTLARVLAARLAKIDPAHNG